MREHESARGGRGEDVDAAFADIVAHWHQAADGHPSPTNPPWRPRTSPAAKSATTAAEPAAEGAPGDAGAPTDSDAGVASSEPVAPPHEAPPPPWRRDPTHSVAEALLGAQEWDESDDDGWRPPATAPLPPVADRLFWGALAGLVLGPVLLLWLVLARPAVSTVWVAVAVLLIVGGFGCLVARQPHRRSDDGDDGARV